MTALVVSSVLVLGAAAVIQTAAASPAAAAAPGTALINGDTVSGGYASLEAQAAVAAGLTVTVVRGADWDAMTAEQFGTYQVLIAGDPGCGRIADTFTSNVSTWAPVVMGVGGGRTLAGNRVVIGTDPALHSGEHPGGVTLINDGVAFAGSQPGRTGLYFDTTCGGNYYGQPGGALSTLSSLSTGAGAWTENDQPPCGGNVAKIASTATFDSLKSSDLAGWGCSVHESFPTFPGDWHPLAIATDTPTAPTCGTDVDTGATACGQAYVLIAGSDIVVTSPDLTLLPATSTDPSGGTHTVTATVTRAGEAVPGATVTFTVTGVNAGVTGTCSVPDCTTDSNGQVSFTYPDSNGAGDDTITASFTDAVSGGLQSATASEQWTLAPQTITVTAGDRTITYGDAQPTYTWTTTSTGADTLSTSPTCGVSLTPSAAGSYPISCSDATAPDGDTIVYEPGTLTIAPAPVEVIADNQTTVYGDPDPTFTSTTSGLLGEDSLTTTAACSVTGPHADVGNYPITCSGADAGDNYAISYQPGSLTVTAKPITVTADSFSIVYGQPAPTFTSTTAGLETGDSLATPATCTVAGAHTKAAAYPITCAGADAGENYAISYLPGTFTIASKPGVVTADPKTVGYGSADPTFTYTVSGVQPGDTLVAAPTCAVPGTHTSVGTYPIVCSGGDGGSAYALSYVAGTLTISKAPVNTSTSSTTIVHRHRRHPFRYRFTTKVVNANTGAPVPGSVVTVTTGRMTVCRATTTDRGVATCTNEHRINVYWVRRYTATSSATADYDRGRAHAVIYAFCTHQTHGSPRAHAEVREECLEGPRGRDHD